MKRNNTDVDLNIPIGAAVRAWREARALTVTELAQRAGRPITKSYLSELENGKIQSPGAIHLNRIASTLGIPVLYLVARWLPDQVPEATEDARPHQITQHRIRFRAPDISVIADKDFAARTNTLREALQNIDEISRQIEQLRQVIKDLIQRDDKEQ